MNWRNFPNLRGPIVRAHIVFLASAVIADAAESPEKLAEERARLHERSPAEFAPVTDAPSLPRVLLIGDSISIGYTLAVRQRLQGVANVHRAFENCGTTFRGVQQIDAWLGSGHWDVIHFNFGLHDIAWLDQKQPRTSKADYERNLRMLTARLRATGAKVIFATTTPVPVIKEVPIRITSDAVAYNAIARRLMAELDVPVDDLDALAEAQLKALQLPNNVHYTAEGYAALGEAVAASIRSALPKH